MALRGRVMESGLPDAGRAFRVEIRNGLGNTVTSKRAEFDEKSGLYRAQPNWIPGIGAWYPSEHAHYGVIRTDSYYARILPAEPGRSQSQRHACPPDRMPGSRQDVGKDATHHAESAFDFAMTLPAEQAGVVTGPSNVRILHGSFDASLQ